jgi:NAD(P)-dependent dehydrogenase (short-subunit alcohol dehydrogenase family)
VSLAKAGCENLILADMSQSSLEQTVKSCSAAGSTGLKTFLLQTDLEDESATMAMMGDAVNKCEVLLYFVNCAGILPSYSSSQNISYEDFKLGAEAGQRAVLKLP